MRQNIRKLVISGMLIAIGLIIPMFSPLKIVLEPASFTLASHVAIFIAMFISPVVALSVAVGTTFGFLLGGFPIIVVLRAATHIVFALVGSFYLHRISKNSFSDIKLRIFSFFVALIHALGELVVVSIFYFGGNVSPAYFEQGFFMSVLLLVGLGTVIHSMVDFEIAWLVQRPLSKQSMLFSRRLSGS
jgi:niacin transporter